MTKLTLRFPSTGKIFAYQVAEDFQYDLSDKLLVETVSGIEVAEIYQCPADARSCPNGKSDKVETGEGKILRVVTSEDRVKIDGLKNKTQEYLPICQKKVDFFALPMKIVDAELSYDEKKLTFYFSADGRVDFRQLVADLAHEFRKSIRLQQIGARDRVKVFGGYGRCGQEVCCRRFLPSIESITLDKAISQNLDGLGSAKISGLCGRLMCCLGFEAEQYQKIRNKLPLIGAKIKTRQGQATVIGQNIFNESVTAKLQDGKKIEVEI